MGRGVLAFGAQVSRDERVEALQIVAAALYPEEVPSQRRDSAMVYLRQLVRLAPDRDMPRAISWRGLDSLLAQTKRTTFGAVARPQRENELVGLDPGAGIPVNTSKAARFYLAAVPTGGQPILIDSAGPGTQGFLRLRVLYQNRLRLASGTYQLRVIAIDAAAPDTITIRFNATVSAPAPTLTALPVFDSAQIRPEVMPPSRGRNIAIGLGVGAATVVLAQVFRAGDPVKAQASSDSKAFVVGGAIALGAILAGTRDRGTPQPRNVAFNATLRSDYQARVAGVQTQNAARLSTYRATISIDPEAR